MNRSNFLKTALAFFTLLACTLVLSQLPIVGSEKRTITDEPIDGFGPTERRDVISQTSMNVLDSDGNIREQATLYIIPDVVSVRGCQSDCLIKFAFGDQIILARRDHDGLFTEQPFILPRSDDAVDRNSVDINPTTRMSFIMIGKHSYVSMFDRGTRNVSIGNTEPNSFLARRDVDNRVAAFIGGGFHTEDCPNETDIVDDSCTVRGNEIEYCWTIKIYDCNGVEIQESRGCTSFPNGPGIDCTMFG